MKSFEGKRAYIPGGSMGIGLAAAKILAGEGAHVVLFARNEDALAKAANEIRAARKNATQQVETRRLDVADHEAATATMNAVVTELGAPDLLINCAGVSNPAYFEDVTLDMLDQVMRVNLYGTWSVTQALAPHLKSRAGSAIVNVSSVAGFLGIIGFTHYSASKFAVMGFSEALRMEMKRHGVSVHVLCPPDTDTPGLRAENETKPPECIALSEGGGLLSAEQVARAMLDGVKTGRFMIVPGAQGRFAWLAQRLVPGVVRFELDRQLRSFAKKRG